jgi:hypothetical protein
MNSNEVWQQIISDLSSGKKDIQTTPMNSRKPLWFSAEVVNDNVLVDSAIEKRPSCNLNRARTLSLKKLEQVLPFYIKREEGEKVSKEVTHITRHQVYYYGLIRKALSDSAL